MASRFFLSTPGIVNALGSGADAVAAGLFAGDLGGMVLEAGWLPQRDARVGRTRAAPASMPPRWADHASMTHRLLLEAAAQIEGPLERARSLYGAGRIGVVLGTSTSGIAEGERAVARVDQGAGLPADYRYSQQEIGAPAPFLALALALGGPAFTVSTACTSSTKAFGAARNLLRFGVCDAVVVGGADSLARLTLGGFAALESLTDAHCNPMSRHRRGINIGEGAALFLMSQEETDVEFAGIGESSDAHHMSAPHPEGLGAEFAMRAALADAALAAENIDYLNLHATATAKNDEAESLAVSRVFPHGVPASGTKPLTGHLLGAAGATELAFCWMALRRARLPPHVWDGEADPALPPLDLVQAGTPTAGRGPFACMSNSFAFGGSNAVAVLRAAGRTA